VSDFHPPKSVGIPLFPKKRRGWVLDSRPLSHAPPPATLRTSARRGAGAVALPKGYGIYIAVGNPPPCWALRGHVQSARSGRGGARSCPEILFPGCGDERPGHAQRRLQQPPKGWDLGSQAARVGGVQPSPWSALLASFSRGLPPHFAGLLARVLSLTPGVCRNGGN